MCPSLEVQELAETTENVTKAMAAVRAASWVGQPPLAERNEHLIGLPSSASLLLSSLIVGTGDGINA